MESLPCDCDAEQSLEPLTSVTHVTEGREWCCGNGVFPLLAAAGPVAPRLLQRDHCAV